MRRPGYREAIEWLAGNDDCYWLGDDEPMISVSAAMVRDLYGVDEARLHADLIRALRRAYPNHEALKGRARHNGGRSGLLCGARGALPLATRSAILSRYVHRPEREPLARAAVERMGVRMVNRLPTFLREGWHPRGPGACGCPDCGRTVSTNALARASHKRGCKGKPERDQVKGKAQMTPTLYLVACVKTKLPHGSRACDLYVSPWFKLARRYVEARGGRWRILSARHGIVCPHEWVEPYNETLARMPIAARREWAARVCAQIDALPYARRVVILAGVRYREFLVDALRRRYGRVEVPLRGLGIGRQLQRLAK